MDFNARNRCLTAKLLQQGHRYHKLRKTFSKFYRRQYELISKFNVKRLSQTNFPPELQLNETNKTDTEAPFLDLHLSIANGFVSSKIYDKRDDFDFDIVNFPFSDGGIPRRAFYGVYLFDLLESAIMLRTLMRVINV